MRFKLSSLSGAFFSLLILVSSSAADSGKPSGKGILRIRAIFKSFDGSRYHNLPHQDNFAVWQHRHEDFPAMIANVYTNSSGRAAVRLPAAIYLVDKIPVVRLPEDPQENFVACSTARVRVRPGEAKHVRIVCRNTIDR